MKPILCFYIGYVPDLNDNIEVNYGSEITLLKLADEFKKKYRVIIFGSAIYKEITVNEVEYLNSNKIEEFQKNNKVDIFIISRYIHAFLDFEIIARKIFLWVHDLHILKYYQSKAFPDEGKYLLKNILHKLDGVITISNFHKQFFLNYYEIDPSKVFVIRSAIDPSMFKGNFEKQKNRFIWTSHGYRGMDKLIEYFYSIRQRIPDAELYVYRDKTAFSEDILEIMDKCEFIHYVGKLEHDKIPDEFEKSEIWFYPTNFEETYCMSAVEAQMAKCICVGTDIGALTETIADRGILVKEPIYSEQYKQRAIDEIVDVLNNEERKKDLQEKGYQWALTETWDKRAQQWYELFEN